MEQPIAAINKLPFHSPEFLARLAFAIAEAGQVAHTIFQSYKFGQQSKGKAGPVTTADILVNRILHVALKELLPEAAWLSEETPDARERLDAGLVWIVDPIDGTREFAGGVPEYSISIGLVREGQAVLGAIAVPEDDLVLVGGECAGLYETSLPAESKILVSYPELKSALAGSPGAIANAILPISAAMLTGKSQLAPIAPPRQVRKIEEARIAVSASEHRKGVFSGFEGLTLVPSGSVARKLALLACGKYDLQLSLYPKNEWDICGGIALLKARQDGAIELLRGQPIVFNQNETRTYGLLAGPQTLVEQVYERFQSAGRPLFHVPPGAI